jgi:hypothetical protein
MDHASSMSTPDLARLLTDAGFRVWPLVRGPAKRPARAGFGRAVSPPPSAAPETFRPDADVAVLMGPCPIAGDAHRLVGVDFDGPVPDEVKARFPATWTTHDGAHLYYFVRADAPYVQTNALLQGELEDGAMWQVDVRDHGGYLAISRDGVPYFDPHDPTEVPITEIDVALLRRERAEAGAEPGPAPEMPSQITSRPSSRMLDSWAARFIAGAHQRNDLAGAFGGALARWGYNDAEIERVIRGVLGDFDAVKVRKAVDDATRAARDLRAGVANRTGLPRLEALGVVIETEVALQSRLEADEVAALIAAEPADGFDWALGADKPLSAEDFERAPPEPRWLVRDLGVHGQVTLLGGYGGAGKTLALQDLALAVATPGRRWLGRFAVDHGPVVHIDHENGRGSTIRRYRSLLGDDPAPDDLRVYTAPSWRLWPDGLRALAPVAARARLVVIDSFLVTVGHMDENDARIRQPLDALMALAEQTPDTSYVVVAHFAKESGRKNGKGFRGSGGIRDAVPTTLAMERDDSDSPTVRLRLEKRREEPDDLHPGWWEVKLERPTPGRILLVAAPLDGAAVEPAAPHSPAGPAKLGDYSAALARALADGPIEGFYALRSATGLGTETLRLALARCPNVVQVERGGRNGKTLYRWVSAETAGTDRNSAQFALEPGRNRG